MQKKHLQIYKSRKHLLFTLFTIIIPFLFLLFFSRLIHIAITELAQDIFVSFSRLVAAYIISVILAWFSAVFFYRGKAAEIALPFFDVLQSFPLFAVLPLAAFYWGPSNFTVIFFLIVAIVWPIFFSVISSLKLMKHDWVEAVEISGLKGFNYFRYFLLPASVPGLVTGSIVGLGDGWEALVATEIIVKIKGGLGSFFQIFSANPLITAFGVLGFLMLIFTVNKIIWLPLLEWSHHKTEE